MTYSERVSKSDQEMEEFFLRFPHICLMIFDTLDNQTLVKCRLVSKKWKSCIDGEKIVWLRMIQKFIGRKPNLKRNIYLKRAKKESYRTNPYLPKRCRTEPRDNFRPR